jgi:hypothetical protein
VADRLGARCTASAISIVPTVTPGSISLCLLSTTPAAISAAIPSPIAPETASASGKVSASYTHDAVVLGNFRRFVAINGALEVDLTGQVNSETAGGQHIGIGVSRRVRW